MSGPPISDREAAQGLSLCWGWLEIHRPGADLDAGTELRLWYDALEDPTPEQTALYLRDMTAAWQAMLAGRRLENY
jgi:hypothetical protein